MTLTPNIRLPNVLVADDDLSILSAIEKGLERLGYPVVPVHNGIIAVEQIISSDFDCVVTDWHMPGGGEMVVRAALLKNPDRPIIVITGSREDTDWKTAYDVGASIVIAKPFSIKGLAAQISEIVGAD